MNPLYREGLYSGNYRITPMLATRPDCDDGGKIILPPSALQKIAQLNLVYPLLFELSNPQYRSRRTHCGVLEFTATEGRAILPLWMLQSLGLDPDELVCVKSVNLPRASFVKFQPQSVDFLDISNPKAVLEIILRKYAALTIGDIIVLRYNDREYYLRVLEARPINPHNAVSIIETDMQVDFAPPVGYEEVKKPSPEVESNASNKGQVKIDKAKLHEDEYVDSDSESEEDKKRWKPFSGVGMRISGKAVNDHSKSAEALSKSLKSSEASGPQMPQRTPASKKFVPFSGPGYTLREPRTI